jgi:hypothetical protein
MPRLLHERGRSSPGPPSSMPAGACAHRFIPRHGVGRRREVRRVRRLVLKPAGGGAYGGRAERRPICQTEVSGADTKRGRSPTSKLPNPGRRGRTQNSLSTGVRHSIYQVPGGGAGYLIRVSEQRRRRHRSGRRAGCRDGGGAGRWVDVHNGVLCVEVALHAGRRRQEVGGVRGCFLQPAAGTGHRPSPPDLKPLRCPFGPRSPHRMRRRRCVGAPAQAQVAAVRGSGAAAERREPVATVRTGLHRLSPNFSLRSLGTPIASVHSTSITQRGRMIGSQRS